MLDIKVNARVMMTVNVDTLINGEIVGTVKHVLMNTNVTVIKLFIVRGVVAEWLTLFFLGGR